MKCIAFTFSASGIQSWTPEVDSVVNYVQCTSNAVTVSTDPAMVSTDLTGPTSNKIIYDLISFGSAGTASSTFKPGGEMKIPVPAGRKVFVSVPTQGSVVMYYDDAIPAE